MHPVELLTLFPSNQSAFNISRVSSMDQKMGAFYSSTDLVIPSLFHSPKLGREHVLFTEVILFNT